jgi:hypothetical protein
MVWLTGFDNANEHNAKATATISGNQWEGLPRIIRVATATPSPENSAAEHLSRRRVTGGAPQRQTWIMVPIANRRNETAKTKIAYSVYLIAGLVSSDGIAWWSSC